MGSFQFCARAFLALYESLREGDKKDVLKNTGTCFTVLTRPWGKEK
jgi:hypothetical protein